MCKKLVVSIFILLLIASIALIILIFEQTYTGFLINKPELLSNLTAGNFTGNLTSLICQNTLINRWHYGECRDCKSGYQMVECTKHLWFRREICQGTYETNCTINPSCKEGDKVIKKISCSQYTPAINCKEVYKNAEPPFNKAQKPIEFLEQRKNYMIFNDVSETLKLKGGGTWERFYCNRFIVKEEGFLKVHPDDSEVLVVFYALPNSYGSTAGVIQNPGGIVTGIGTNHPASSFGPQQNVTQRQPKLIVNPNSKIVQITRMGNWWGGRFVYPSGELNNFQLSWTFGAEFIHRWVSYVFFKTNTTEFVEEYNMTIVNGSSKLLGSELAHWSFYVAMNNNTGICGASWIDNGDGSFTSTQSPYVKGTFTFYSDLDLYLMGMIPPEDVELFFIIDNPHDCRVNGIPIPCPNRFYAPPCAPINLIYTVKGDRINITVQDIIDYEGVRIPNHTDSQKVFNMSFILIKEPSYRLTEKEKLEVERIVERMVDAWDKQTRGQSQVNIMTLSG